MRAIALYVAVLSFSLTGQVSACDLCHGEWRVVSSPLLVRNNHRDCTTTWRKGRIRFVTLDAVCLINKVGRGIKKTTTKVGKVLHDNLCLCPQHRRSGLFNPLFLRRLPIIGRIRVFRD